MLRLERHSVAGTRQLLPDIRTHYTLDYEYRTGCGDGSKTGAGVRTRTAFAAHLVTVSVAVATAWSGDAEASQAVPSQALDVAGESFVALQVADRRIALTFDDLPMTGGSLCDVEGVHAVTRQLTNTLAGRSLPATGFVTARRPCLGPELLRETLARWTAAGASLGNHSATHPDVDTTPMDAYLADIEEGQRLLEAAAPGAEAWFRHPLLHTGADPARKERLTAHLRERGYRVAPVTVDNQEWVYAAVYADARARGDGALADRVAEAYVEHLEAATRFYERLSVDVFEREIPQVLLLHANLLNAERMEAVIEMLERRGYAFVALEDALENPAYARPDTYVGPRGLSWLQRWALEDGIDVPDEPREADWVARAFARVRGGL